MNDLPLVTQALQNMAPGVKIEPKTRVLPKWRIEFCMGKMDDPQHGAFTLYASTVATAIQAAEKAGIYSEWIDSIERSDP